MRKHGNEIEEVNGLGTSRFELFFDSSQRREHYQGG